MCVIIDRQPGVVIPAGMLEQACDINKHGFGIAYPKNGKLYFLRSLENNDPKEVADHLQKLKDVRVFLHLRHATVGQVTLENSHPFQILHKTKDGVDLAWMHNGTLWDYKPKDGSSESDTLVFHRKIVEPAAIRIVKHTKKVTEDPIFQHILAKDTGYSSIFFVFDGHGNTFVTNKDKGKEYEGWWASNDYSFKADHPRSSTYTPPTRHYNSNYHHWCGFDTVDPWEDADPKTIQITEWEKALEAEDKKTAPLTTATRTKYECVKIKDMIHEAKGEGIVKDGKVTLTELKVLKDTFTQLSGLNNLDGIGRLTEGDLVSMAQTYPVGTARLVLELFSEKLELEARNKNLSACLKETA